jgi:hypothetical protein
MLPEPPLPNAATAPLLAPPAAAPTRPASLREWLAHAWLRRRLSCFVVSLILHLLVLIALALTYFGVRHHPQVFALTIWPQAAPDDEPLTMVELPPSTYSLPGEIIPDVNEAFAEAEVPEIPDLIADNAGEPEPQGDAYLTPDKGELRAEHLLAQRPGQGGGLEGRSDEVRAAMVGKRGGTPASETAVANGLAWLAAHQRPNGSWNFDHRGDACNGQCDNAGTAGTTTGATALALLPFLGAGQTHLQGEHREVIKQGLYYLQGRIRHTPHGGDAMEGTMYGQGLTAIALCEAYSLSKDKNLRPFAQEAIDFICYAQHPEGGWRYFPGQPGDTTVFGWQFMALKSAYLAKLEVPSPVIERAQRYLDSVQSGGGVNYGYLRPAQDPTPTAVGLLSRMYLGWPHDKPELAKGVAYLAKLGPSKEDLYFDYYATQVLHHYDGPAWEKWNVELREYLIKTQATQGHARGSWYFPDKHGLAGGRLYNTALGVMILEVYYRHMPLYGEKTVKEGF